MADPSPSFMPLLMTWVFKEESFCTLNTNSFFSKNIHSPSLTLLFLFKHPYPSSPTESSYHVAGEKQGSSPCKGKAIASDSPAVPDVGEEMEHSDSEQSAEEETQRNPNSECAPLIDPWYEVHPHFPKFPGDYVPPRRVMYGLPLSGETPTSLGLL